MAKGNISIPHPADRSPEQRLIYRLRGESRHKIDSPLFIRSRAAGAAAIGALAEITWGWPPRIICRDDMTLCGRRNFDMCYAEVSRFMQSSAPDLHVVEGRRLPGLEYPEAYGVLGGLLVAKLTGTEISPVQAMILGKIQQEITPGTTRNP